jgi:hypothetical protein
LTLVWIGAAGVTCLALGYWGLRQRGGVGISSSGAFPSETPPAETEIVAIEPRFDSRHRSVLFETEIDHGACTVSVLSENRDPIPAALLSVVLENVDPPVTFEPLTTSETGTTSIPGLPEKGARIVAEKESFSTETILYKGGNAVEIILHPGWTAGGVVEWGDGRPAADVLVLALPVGRALQGNELNLIRRGIGGMHGLVTRTRDDGSFTISGLRHAESYNLTAVGPGSASLKPPTARQDAALGHVVRIEAIYALEVEITDERGKALKTSDRLFGRGQSWRVKDPTVRSLPYLPAWLELAGADWLGSAHKQTSHEVLLLFLTEDQRVEIADIEFSVHVPGYLPLGVDLRAPRLGREPQRKKLEASATSRLWGDIEIVVDSSTLHPLQSGEPSRNLGTLFLHGLDTTDVSVRVQQTPSGREVIRGVPAGAYEGRFEARNTPFYFPPLDEKPLSVLVADKASPAVVRLDPGRAGTFILELTQEGGARYDRAVLFLLERVQHPLGGGRSYTSFEGPPYIIDLIRPGDYVVRIISLADGNAQQQSELLLPSVEGETVFAEFPLRLGR